VAMNIWRTLTHPDALIENEAALFQSAQFSSAVLALFLFFVGMAAWLLMTVLFLQNAWGYSALSSGLAIAPGPMTAAVFAVNSPRVSARFGRRVPAVLGPLLAGSGCSSLRVTPTICSVHARLDPRRRGRRAHAGAALRRREQLARQPRHDGKRRAQHGPTDRQRARRGYAGGAAGHRAPERTGQLPDCPSCANAAARPSSSLLAMNASSDRLIGAG